MAAKLSEPGLIRDADELVRLAEVASRWRIADVVVQDEYSHDVLVELPDGRALAFDAT